MTMPPGAERARVDGFGRLDLGMRQASDWYLWGPYMSERQWGTVREDYSADGDAWSYLPHDHARSRAYRWGEDALAGFCDIEQRLCLALTLWNGRDPILKERAFGLTGADGNHGEDVKEYWWYLDALPSHAWNSWRYHYPQREFPYRQLLDENRRRGKFDFEYELLDTGVFDDDRYWIVDVSYAKADPADVLMAIYVTNAGPEPELLHVLPTFGTATPGPGTSLRSRRRWPPPPTARWPSSIPSSVILNCCLGRTRKVAARSCCSARTRRMLLGYTGLQVARGGPRTASTTMSWPGPTLSTRSDGAPSARRGTGSRWPPARPPSCACGCIGLVPVPTRPRHWAPTSLGS